MMRMKNVLYSKLVVSDNIWYTKVWGAYLPHQTAQNNQKINRRRD